MAHFLDAEAVESDDEDELTEAERKKAKRMKAIESDDEDDSADEAKLREELKDLIDDNPIEDDSDDSSASRKRKKSDDEDDLDDRFEDEDYDLIEENLGVRVARRKRFKRVRRIEEDDYEGTDIREDRDAIADELFAAGDGDNEEDHPLERRRDEDYGDDEEMADESDVDDFIVDEEGRPVTEKRKKRRQFFNDAALQEAQDIFGVDFDYDDIERYDGDSEEDEDDYIDETGEGRRRKSKTPAKKKPSRKSIFEIYEPSELKRGHFTDLDNKIRSQDIPERMQLRDIPVTKVPEDSNELEEEAEWIYKQAFCKPTISTQDTEGGADPRNITKKGNPTIGKIKKALHFMRNDLNEVPFIAFYRKEYVMPELKVNDLWKVFKYDGMWCQLKARKAALLELFENMCQYQLEEYTKDLDAELPEDMRLLTDEDIAQLKAVETAEELNDVHLHFLLYYSHLIPKVQAKQRAKEREERRQARRELRRKRRDAEDGGENVADEPMEEGDSEQEPEEDNIIKPAVRGGAYIIYHKTNLGAFVKYFGLKPEHFAENVRDDYQRHDVDQVETLPDELAEKYCNSFLLTPTDVLKAAKYVVATQISREPLVRKALREAFFKGTKLNVAPTKKGEKEIDENHPCYTVKYLKEKPVRELVGVEFLKLHNAEEDGLIKITFDEDIDGVKTTSMLDEMKMLYNRDEFSSVVQEWNRLRHESVELAFRKMLWPSITKELRTQLLAEAKECVLKQCSQKLYNWLKVAPYTVDFEDEEGDDWDSSKGIRVMGLAYVPDFEQASFACIVAPDGDCTEYKRLPNLLKRKNSYREDERLAKEKDINELRDFIAKKKPHVICVGAESRDALMIVEDIKEVIKQLVEDEQFPIIPVEILDNDLAKIYANSNKGKSDFRDYPELLRQAISLARRLQDPLMEFSQLCTADDEILCLRYHSLQEYVSKEDLLEAITREFVNRTNEVGVDINAAVQNSYSGNLLQYICGLGTRKATALIKMMKQTNQRLENRTQLVTTCHMGPLIFVNCAGFIKIDTNALGDSTEAYVEVLDGSRVHPEAYEWARKMAVDALEYDDEDTNPTQALEEILEAPERLKDLDLDAFAEELARQGFGNKSITLYDIRAELNHRYKDQRTPYTPPTEEELFDLLTKETPETFYIGKLVQAQVVGIARKKPQTEQLDQANPVRDAVTELWQCPFCLKSDFPELSEVWAHFDAGSCAGQPVGIRVRLDNGISGFIHLKNLSDKHVIDPEERVRIGQMIHCRIMSIDVQKFSVEATSKATDLNDINNRFRPQKDVFYDQSAEEADRQVEEKKRKLKAAQAYIKRVITHSSFKNCSYKEAILLLEHMDQGECLIRPSSKGADHLTVTWKVTDGIYQHVDILEKDKKNAFSLGQTLMIGKKKFEDLEEIRVCFIEPMKTYASELLSYKYYKDTDGGNTDKAEAILREAQKKDPSKIHYIISASAKYAGKFLLSYLPRKNFRHEYITVTPEGYRFRNVPEPFESVDALLKWFKIHFREEVPRTPAPTMFPQTPNMMGMHMTPGMPTPHYGYSFTPGAYPPAFLTPHATIPFPTPNTNQMEDWNRQGYLTPSQQPMFSTPAVNQTQDWSKQSYQQTQRPQSQYSRSNNNQSRFTGSNNNQNRNWGNRRNSRSSRPSIENEDWDKDTSSRPASSYSNGPAIFEEDWDKEVEGYKDTSSQQPRFSTPAARATPSRQASSYSSKPAIFEEDWDKEVEAHKDTPSQQPRFSTPAARAASSRQASSYSSKPAIFEEDWDKEVEGYKDTSSQQPRFSTPAARAAPSRQASSYSSKPAIFEEDWDKEVEAHKDTPSQQPRFSTPAARAASSRKASSYSSKPAIFEEDWDKEVEGYKDTSSQQPRFSTPAARAAPSTQASSYSSKPAIFEEDWDKEVEGYKDTSSQQPTFSTPAARAAPSRKASSYSSRPAIFEEDWDKEVEEYNSTTKL